MKKNIVITVLSIAVISTLFGCSNKENESTAVSATESVENIEGDVIEEPASDSNNDLAVNEDAQDSAEDAIDENDEEASSSTWNVINNNAHFVQIGDYVYFHMPDEDAMHNTALWCDFADINQGGTILFRTDVNTNETTPSVFDQGWGKMHVCGDALIYEGIRQGGEDTVIYRDTLGGEELSDDIFDGMNILGCDEDGQYLYAYKDYDVDMSNELFVYGNDELLDYSFITDGYCTFVAARSGKLYFTQTVYSKEDFVSTVTLHELNVSTGDMITLGVLPRDEYDYGGVEQAIIVGDELYLSYCFYGGTGHFYSSGVYLKATSGIEDSLTEIEPNDCPYDFYVTETDAYDIDSQQIPVRADGGSITLCDGAPMTAAVIGDYLGYFNEEGQFTEVASGFARVEDEETGVPLTEVEVAELVGDSIYIIMNDAEHTPEEDVGWRYAYKRLNTYAKRVDIKTGEITELVCIRREE